MAQGCGYDFSCISILHGVSGKKQEKEMEEGKLGGRWREWQWVSDWRYQKRGVILMPMYMLFFFLLKSFQMLSGLLWLLIKKNVKKMAELPYDDAMRNKDKKMETWLCSQRLFWITSSTVLETSPWIKPSVYIPTGNPG